MSDRETGVEEARKILGKLVDDAALEGDVTYLTRRGRRYAAIVPLDRIKETAVSDATDIIATLKRPADEYGSGWDWADAATDAWLDAARAAGLAPEVNSIEVDHVDYEAAIIDVDGALYVLEVRQDEVRAVPKPAMAEAYTIDVDPNLARWLTATSGTDRLGGESGTRYGLEDLGDGRVKVPAAAVVALMDRDEDNDGVITNEGDHYTMWFGGLDYRLTPETPDPTTYTAAIVTAASDVEGNFCDVTVAENVIATYRENEDGKEIPEYMMGDKIMMPAQETTVRIDDEDPWARLEDEAEQILAENGWRVTGKWELSDNAAYAPVELA